MVGSVEMVESVHMFIVVGGVSYLGRRNFKMQGIRRNKKENGCVPSIMRF